MKKTKAKGRTGRPREFDADAALDRAVEIFWRKGYEATSLSDLTEAMGINRPSLYAAFGDKEALFRRVIERYEQGLGGYVFSALNLPTAREVASETLNRAVEVQTNPKNPPGCLFVQGTLSCTAETKGVRNDLAERRKRAIAAFTERFKRAKHEGDLPSDADPGALALFLMSVTQGMAVLSSGGATKAELRKIANSALRSFPS